MQSGITVSNELSNAFKTFLNNSNSRALLARIDRETIVPVETLPATSSFPDDLTVLAPHIKPDQALYILVRTTATTNNNSDSTPLLAAVTYVPNAAPVRQKTLFASTRLTLTRALGAGHFGESLFVTEAEELTPGGWRAYETHVAADAPLTEEERGLVGIKEAEVTEVSGTGRRGAGYGDGIAGKSMDCGDGVLEALKALGEKDMVVLKIDDKERIVLAEGEGGKGISPAQLGSKVNDSSPRYTLYGYSHASLASGWGVIFIYTCPTATKVRDRMIYASSRRSAEVLASKNGDIDLARRIEVSDPSELTVSMLESEFAPKQETKSGFARPKRPGRK